MTRDLRPWLPSLTLPLALSACQVAPTAARPPTPVASPRLGPRASTGFRYSAALPAGFVPGAPEDVSGPPAIRRLAFHREGVEDQMYLSSLLVSEIAFEGPRRTDLDSHIEAVFSVLEPELVAGDEIAALGVYRWMSYGQGWIDQRGRFNLEYAYVWKGCERHEQYTRAVVVAPGRLVSVALHVDGSAPPDLLKQWLKRLFDEPFGSSAPSRRRALTGESSLL